MEDEVTIELEGRRYRRIPYDDYRAAVIAAVEAENEARKPVYAPLPAECMKRENKGRRPKGRK